MPHHPSVLNVALANARFCPRCAGPADVHFPRFLTCEPCGYTAYFNPAPVAGVVPIEPDGRVWLLRRGFPPGEGRWSIAGGFVDLGESVEEAAHRETLEEMGIEVELGQIVGVYSRADQRVVLIVYAARPLGTPRPCDEAPEVRAFSPDEIPWDELAFWSDESALRDCISSEFQLS